MVRFNDSVPIRNNYFQQLSVNASSGAYVGKNRRKGYDVLQYEPDGGTQGARVSLAPKIRYVYHYDASLTGTARWVLLAKWDDPSIDEMLDGAKLNTRLVNVMATADYIYIASTTRTAGWIVDLDGTILNNNASTLTFEYSDNAGFTATAITDGTDTGGATMGVTLGNVTIDSVPAEGTWVSRSLEDLNPANNIFPVDAHAKTEPFYWGRLDVSAVLDNVEIEQLIALDPEIAKGTTDGTGGAAKEDGEYAFLMDDDVGGVVAVSTDSGTPKLNVTWWKRSYA